MADVTGVLAANRDAVDDLITAAERCEPAWTTPRAPGKWSPSQVVEHVALVLEEGANVVAGAPSKLPTLPALLRPLMRGLFFRRILKNSAFPKLKTNRAMDPSVGPATPAAARVRLDAALARFDQECRARTVAGEKVDSGAFGSITVEEYARFQELHTRHHTAQMPGAN